MKRRFSQLQDEPTLRLHLADDAPDEPYLVASCRLLYASSSCASGLPRDSSTWDLSNLLIDGQPVGRGTVVAWLNAVHMHQDDAPYLEGVPPAAANATRLYQLLAFADAVGSSRGVVKACLAGLDRLELPVVLGEQTFQLQSSGTVQYCWYKGTNKPYALQFSHLTNAYSRTLDASAEQRQSFTQQLVGQVEPLLHLAYRLQLAPLQEALQRFTRSNMQHPGGLLFGHMRRVLTPRVMEAALSSGTAQEAMLHLLTSQRVVLAPANQAVAEGADVLLGQVGAPLLVAPGPQGFERQAFNAVVKRLPGLAAGDVVTVMLDLMGSSSLHVGPALHTCQLLTGVPLGTPAQRQAALGKEPAP